MDIVVTRFYVSDKNQNFYYSESGNKKIDDALKNGDSSVILNNEDLNISHNSHQFQKNNKVLVHYQSGTSFPINISAQKVTFTLKGRIYEMPQKEATKVQKSMNLNIPEVDLSLGVYEIKFDTMEQINVFSGYSRKLMKE